MNEPSFNLFQQLHSQQGSAASLRSLIFRRLRSCASGLICPVSFLGTYSGPVLMEYNYQGRTVPNLPVCLEFK